jgi:diguanylate cyclase (GGDEF)-like protein
MMSNSAALTKPRHILQRPGAVYRFQASHKKGYTKVAESQVLQMQARIAELEATLADRTAQLKLAFEEAGTDILTGLKNRRAWDERLREAAVNWRRYGHMAAVLVLDLDGFKAVNDTYGHAAGDAVLQHIAGLLTHHTRSTDVVARLGGDEFAILLRGAETAGAIDKARSLRAALAESPLIWRAESLEIGFSIGLATLVEAPEPHAVMQIADARMYQFKRVAKAVR